MKRADSISNRLFGRELNNAPAAPSTFRTISSDRSKGALQFTRLADHNPPHRHLQATGLQVPALATVLARMEDLESAELSHGQCAECILEELHSFLRTRGPESAVPKFAR